MGRGRGKGEGSVLLRSDGRWIAQVQTGYKENGTPKYKRSAKMQKAAIEKLDALKGEIHGGNYSNIKIDSQAVSYRTARHRMRRRDA